MHSTGFCVPCPQLCAWFVIRDLSEGRLRPIALPVRGLAGAHGIAAAFVLPMLMAAAQREVLLPHTI
jgi:hypothetical protein